MLVGGGLPSPSTVISLAKSSSSLFPLIAIPQFNRESFLLLPILFPITVYAECVVPSLTMWRILLNKRVAVCSSGGHKLHKREATVLEYSLPIYEHFPIAAKPLRVIKLSSTRAQQHM